MYEYQYPNNLSKKYTILWWTVPEVILIGCMGIITLIITLNNKNPFSFSLTAAVALFAAHFDDRSVFEHTYDLLKFLLTPRTWQYMPDAVLSVSNTSKESTNKSKPKGKKKNSFIPLIVAGVLCVSIVVIMTIPTSNRVNNTTAPAATAKPTASAIASPSATPEETAEAVTPEAVSQAVITFGEQTVNTTVGVEPDYESNVSVTSGDATLAEATSNEIGNGEYYIDTSEVDINTPGSYPVTVNAKDDQGVQTTGTFIVIVSQ